ncbi:MAG: zf-HC2 domain-containing protein [Lachnospiraceae bacterium]|nr:zf-HC2 domain-containing protein [Lachnospiraceae bacterium]
MKCCIVRDLLPGYLDGLTSEETSEDVKAHLEDCAACRMVYEQMSAVLSEKMLPEKKEVDFLRKLKIRIRQRYVFGAFLICALLSGVVGFLKSCDLPVSYDPEKMTVELFQNVCTPNEYGLMQWVGVDTLDSGTAEAAARGDYDTIDEIRLVLKGCVRSDDFTSRGRTIQRDGETVRVVYYCYTRSLWNSLFHPGEDGFVNSSIHQGAIYERNLFRESLENYEPRMREIYYLPMGNMNRMGQLSDEAFDAQRENAVLVWSGKI